MNFLIAVTSHKPVGRWEICLRCGELPRLNISAANMKCFNAS